MVQASGVPADEDWAEFLTDSNRDPGVVFMVVAPGDSKLTPRQRTDVQRWQERHGTLSVLVTDSMVARGVANALGWFGVRVQAFARRDIDRALDVAGIGASDRPEAKEFIARMTAALEDWRKHSRPRLAK